MMLKPLFPSFNVATLHMANRTNPRGWNVSANAPSSLAELKRRAKRDGRITVSSLHSDLTIYGDPEINYAARAWHDACHILADAAFDDAGERAVCELQKRQLRAVYGEASSRLFCAVVDAEIIGQLDYKAANGEFPRDQRTFVLERMAWNIPRNEYLGDDWFRAAQIQNGSLYV